MHSPVSILGCGWLGHALALDLIDRGVEVVGSTTTPEKVDALRADGIEPVRLILDPDLSGTDPGSLFQSPVLVLNIPPPRTDDVEAVHRRQVDAVQEAAVAGTVEWVLFASSTSVYPNIEKTVSEADQPPGRPDALPGSRRRSGEALLTVEKMLLDAPLDTTIVRLGGLYGGGRHPGRFLAGRTDVGRPNAPVNLLHRDDAVGVFRTLLEQDVRGEVFNACADRHPSRRAVYTRAAERLGLEPPIFDKEDAATGKTVSNQKIKDRCGYVFRHPDPLADVEGG